MKNLAVIIVLVVMVTAGYFIYRQNTTNILEEITETQNALEQPAQTAPEPTTNTEVLAAGPSVQPISHASMVLTWAEHTLYVDPVGDPSEYTDLMAPDIVLLTDIHPDHLSTETLAGIIAANTVIVAPQAVYDQLPDLLRSQVLVLANTESTDQMGFAMTAVPMYNLPESADAFHPKGRGNGYLIERNGFKVYIAGDTGPTPEMKALTDIDMAFVPMNQPYTMTVDEAAEAVIAFAPKTAIPYHYRGQDGQSDVSHFKDQVESQTVDTAVVLLNWYPEADAEEGNEEAL